MIRLLLVEDDTNLSYVIQGSLEDIIGGYEVKTAINGKEGLALWKEYKPDVIITDIDMPEMDGYQMVEKIREIDGDTLILFSSGSLKPKYVTDAYKLGANNYVKKPFIPEELDAHIKALMKLKVGSRSQNESKNYKIGSFTLNCNKNTLKNNEGNAIHLTAKEVQVLQILAANKGEVVKRDAIIEHAWEKEEDFYTSRSLDVIINNLRNKMAVEPSVEIKTIKGVGLLLAD